MSDISNKCDDFELPLFVGTDENTQDLFMDFARVRRLLIIGDSGKGKSALAFNMILSLMQQFSPEQCQITLIDTRLLEFPLLENAKHIHHKAFSVEDALDCLQHLDEIIRERYRILAKAECARISDYNAKSKEKLPYIICFINEIADMLVNYPDKTTDLLQRVCNGGPVGVFIALIPLYYKGLSEEEREKVYRNETFFDKIIFYALIAIFSICLLICITTAILILWK